eukprot:PhM_4_TR18848/c1_g1_i6/m.70495
MSEKLSGVLKNSRRGSKTLCAAAVEAAAGPMSRPETPTSGGGPSPTFLNATNNSSPTQQQQQQPSKAVVEPPTTATSNTLAGQMARKKAKQSDANAEALTVPQSHRGPYEIRPYELTFYDAEVEARYCEFQFVENYFIGAIATFVLVVVCYVLLLVDAADDFGDAASVLSLLGIVATFALIGAFYKLQTHRESIALATVCVVSVVAMFHFFQGHPEEQRTVSYLCVTAVAVLLPQVRIHRLVVVFAPLSVLASVVILFAVPGYDPHPTSSHAEDILWLQGFIGWFVLLFFLERKQRMSFCQVDTNRNELKAIENHIEVMQDILATFFPRTPTRDLLAQRVETYSKPYPGTALIVTDISGFTAWSTRTEPRVVIDVLARLMYALESASPEYNVERVYTVGDSFVGAVFPTYQLDDETELDNDSDVSSSFSSSRVRLAGRCVQAILFGVAATQQPHKLGIPLRMRVGVHVGDLLGGFVGRSPPCFDLFGFAMLYAKHMEGTGVPGCVHISREALDSATVLGRPVEPEETEEGVICVGWVTVGDDDPSSHAQPLAATSFNVPQQQQQQLCGSPSGSEMPPFTLPRTVSIVNGSEGTSDTDNHNGSRLLAGSCPSVESGPSTGQQRVLTELSNKTKHSTWGQRATQIIVHRLLQMSAVDDATGLNGHVPTLMIPATIETTVAHITPRTIKGDAKQGSNVAAQQSLITLRFHDDALEKSFAESVRDKVADYFMAFAVLLVTVAMLRTFLVMCLSNSDVHINVAITLVLEVAYIILFWVRSSRLRAWTSVVWWALLQIISTCTAFYSTSCDGGDSALHVTASDVKAVLNFNYFLLKLVCMMAPQFALQTPLLVRLSLLTLTDLSLALKVFYFRSDGALHHDTGRVFCIVCPFGVAFISYAIERTYRSSHYSQHRFNAALESTGRFATHTRQALDVMLPKSIAKKVFASFASGDTSLQPRNEANSMKGDTAALIRKSRSSTVNMKRVGLSSPKLDDLVWEYPLVCAMFVTFHLGHDTYDRVRPILDDMESIATAHGVIKVKTINTLMLCVAGIEDSSAHGVMESTRAMCHTA